MCIPDYIENKLFFMEDHRNRTTFLQLHIYKTSLDEKAWYDVNNGIDILRALIKKWTRTTMAVV